MIACQNCNYSNAPTRKLCSWCGATLQPACPAYTPHTQKARGIYAIRDSWSENSCQVVHVIGCFPVDKPAPIIAFNPGSPIFARPCPPSPEHGFVESREVKNQDELEALRLETLAVNDQSEILLMPLMKAESNMIWTPGLLTIGPGHDGATSGKQVASFPLVGQDVIPESTKDAAGIGPGKWPYLEVVSAPPYPGSNHVPYLTQLRSGPILAEMSLDFIPGEFIVGAVVKTSGEDLLAWARKVKAIAADNLACTDGTTIVVWHPGGGITDHFSVHCRENNVPIILSHQPEIGEIIEGAPLPAADPESMKLGVCAGNLFKPTGQEYESSIVLSLLALHNSSALRGSYSFWLGVAASLLLRFGSAGLRGEARHAHNAKSKVRGNVYEFYVPKGISFHRASLSRVTQILTYGFGDPAASHSFGGKKWGLCGASLAPLFNSIRDLFINPSPETASALTQSLNIVVNQAHNGGWWLNKFCSAGAYDEIPKGNLHWTLSAGNLIWKIAQTAEEASTRLPKLTKDIQSWPLTEIKPLKWRSASMDITPGAFVLNLKAATVPTAIQISVPVTPALLKSLITQVGKVEMNDRTVNFIPPGDSPVIPIWNEVVLDPAESAAQTKAK